MSVIFIIFFLLCLPLAFPSFYLAYKLASKRSLGNIFNQNIFLLFVITGRFTSNWKHVSFAAVSFLLLLCRILHSLLRQHPPLHQSWLSGGFSGGEEVPLQLRDQPEAPGGLQLVQQLQLHDSLQGGRNNYILYSHSTVFMYYISWVLNL